jgi:hypothetical protein
MIDMRSAWTEVADHLTALGLKLKLHAKEELSDQGAESDALPRIRAALGALTDALGDASRDPAVRADLREVADAVVGAVNTTVDEVRTRSRQASDPAKRPEQE